MLRSEELDQEGFEEILTSAMNKMNEHYPVWTDHNPSDPGMAILELMAWYTEVSRYHLNVIGKENIYRYLSFLGYRPQGIRPAKTILKVSGAGRLPAKSRFRAEKIPFETVMDLDVQENRILYVTSGENRIENQNRILEELDGTMLEIHPFGVEEPCKYFEIGFEKELLQENLVGLYFQVRHMEGMAPVDDAFPGILTMKAEYYDGEWKKGMEIVCDETKGFLRSGTLFLRITGTVKKCNSFRIRFSPKDGGYAQLPIITGVVLNAVPAEQKQTFDYGKEEGDSFSTRYDPERVVEKARGICNLRVSLEDAGILKEGLEICVKEREGTFRWSQVEDFDCSTPEDRHFVYDEDTAELVFGDGLHGCPPEGEILLMGFCTSQGAAGNLKKNMVKSEWNQFWAVNILPSFGGRNRESIEECYERLLEDRHKTYRCVTLADYEEAIRNVPGFVIHRIHAYRGKENTVCICVETDGISKQLSDVCLQRVKEYLLPRVLIGTKVEFVTPRYVGIHVYLDVSINPSYQDVKQLTEDALHQYFDGEEAGFGCLIRKNELGRYIHGLPWIRGIKSMEFSASGSGVAVLNNGDVQLEDDCVPFVEHVVVNTVKFK